MGAAKDHTEQSRDEIEEAVLEGGARFERLITAMESQANAVNRLVQVLETKQKKQREGRAARLRRPALDKPIEVTPLVAAAVKRALAKART